MANKKQTRTQTRNVHHLRTIKLSKQLLTYLLDHKGKLIKDLDKAWPRGYGKTGLKHQLHRLNRQLNKPYKNE